MAVTLAHGAILKMGDGADPEVFSAIPGVGDFDFNDSVELVDVTSHSSGGRKEYIADILDTDEISFPITYDDSHATHNRATGLRSKVGQKVNFQLELAGESKGLQFEAVVRQASMSNPVSGSAKQMNVVIKPTGTVTEYDIT